MKPMPYEKRIHLRMISACTLALVSLVFLFLALCFGKNNPTFMSHSSVYLGAFCGMSGANLMLFYRSHKLKKDPVALEQQEREEMDERNVFITRQTHVITTTTFILLIFVAMMIAGFLSQTVFYTLLAVLCCQLMLLGLVYLYVRKQY